MTKANITNTGSLNTSDEMVVDSLASQFKTGLDAGNDALPAHVVSKLRSARETAMESSTKNGWFRLPVVGQHPWMTACASVMALALLIGYGQFETNSDSPFEQLDVESEVLFADEELELYEDLEFYRWLANTGY